MWKTYERNFGTAAEGRYSSESSRDFEVFIEVQAERYEQVRKKGSGKNTLRCTDRLIYITYRLFTVERTVNLHRLINHLNAPCRFSHIACSCNGKIAFFN